LAGNRIMIVGLGDVGSHALELLAMSPGIASILAADVNEDVGKRIVYGARAAASHMGLASQIQFKRIDLNEVEKSAATIKEYLPDIVISTVTLQSPRVMRFGVPQETLVRFTKAGFGMWVPFHIPLVRKLMEAIRKSGLDVHAVSSSFPDVVNCALGKIGLAPTVGCGNFDHLVPGVRYAAAETLGIPVDLVNVYVIASHANLETMDIEQTMGGLPYYLKISALGRDVTDKFDGEKLLLGVAQHLPAEVGLITGASAVKNALGLLSETGITTFCPGPNGLPGGYPVVLSSKGATVDLPEGIDLKRAIGINQESLRGDGIQEIESDGSIVFTDNCVSVFREILGYECKRLRIDECEDRAEELRILLRKLVEGKR
jgi:hypothetical protein